MKADHLVYVLFLFLLVCACSREESTLSDYRSLVKELKVNSSDYTEEDWNNVLYEYELLEEKAVECEFTRTERKELNRLRGQCAAYMLKAIGVQTKLQMEDAMEQFSDMAEGFNEALSEEGFEGLFDFESE